MAMVSVAAVPSAPQQNSPDPSSPDPSSPDPSSPSSKKAHTVGSAALLLMMGSLLSGVLALVRIKYINDIFGAGVAQDAYRAAFKLPDLLSYFLIGGAASISLVTVLNRFRERGDDEGGDRALSVVLCTMLVVLGGGVLLGEIFAPAYVDLANKGFRGDPRAALCTALTRFILPAQLFFFIGSVMSARLQVRRIFIYQALQSPIYNGSIILGAVLLHKQMGVYSLAVGVVVGMLLGAALLNTLGALRTGFRFRPAVSFRDPAFREWLQLSFPLMVGVSLVMFDGIFMNYFASVQVGGVTLISNAKDLFNAPFNIIGAAAGAASLPFFASLFQSERLFEFSASVGRAVSRLFSVGLLVSAWMIALAPWLMDLFRGGRYNRADARETTQLFAVLSVTLGIWAVQGIYARAFYAAGNTRVPAINGTIVVLLSIPVYWWLFRARGLQGLAIASDLGITAQTLSLAVLLHRKRLVSLLHLEFGEIGRAALAAIVAAVAIAFVAFRLPAAHTHRQDGVTIAVGSAVWGLTSLLILQLSGSKLPKQVLRRGR